MNRSSVVRFTVWAVVVTYFLVALGRETYAYYSNIAKVIEAEIALMGTTPHEYFVKIVILFVLVIIASLIDARYRS